MSNVTLNNKIKYFVIFIMLNYIFSDLAIAENITIHKNISNFSALSLNCDGTVYLKLGKKESIKSSYG